MNLQFLRKRNIFGQPPSPYQVGQPTGQPLGMTIPPEEEPSQDDTSQDEEQDTTQDESQAPTNLSNRFSSLYSAAKAVPPGPAEQAYSDFLKKGVPTPDQFQPGKLDRLSAILGGASEGWQRGAQAGTRTAREILDQPYQRAVTSYGMQGKALEKGAEVESKNLGRAASFARTASQSEIAAERARQVELDRVARERHWDAQDRAALARAHSAGFQHTMGSDGHMYFVKPNPDGTHITIDGGKLGESIPEKTKREFEKFSKQEGVRQKNRIEVANVTSSNRMTEEDNRQKGRMQIRQFLQDNKDFKFLAVKGGNYIAVDPTDPSKTVDTGIKTGTLTEKDHIEAGIQGRVQVVDAQAAQNQLRDAKNNAARMALQGQRLEAGAAARDTPQRQNAEIQLRMRKFLAANGQNAKDYFEIDSAGNPTAMKPGDPDDPDYKAIYQYVFGKAKVK